MARENVVKFMELIRTDEALQAKFKAAAEAYDGPRDDEKAIFDAVIAPLTAEAGMPVTYEEGLAEATAERDLSDEELDAVAGGAGCYVLGFAPEGGAAMLPSNEPLSPGGTGACWYGGLTFGSFH